MVISEVCRKRHDFRMTAECLAEMGTLMVSDLYHIDDSKDNEITRTFYDCHFTEQNLHQRKFHHFNISCRKL